MATLQLESFEIETLIKTVSLVMKEHSCPFCKTVWAEALLGKLKVAQALQHPLPQPRTAKQSKANRQPPVNPRRWTAEEDAVIHQFNEDGKPDWAAMLLALPHRSDNSLKGRYSRLGLDKVIAPEAEPRMGGFAPEEPPEGEPAPIPTPQSSAVPTRQEIEQEVTSLGISAAEPSAPQPREPSQIATPASTKEDWGWTLQGPGKHKLMSGR